MSAKKTPVFVQRRTYRRRRVADGARLLPVFGGILFLIPLLWGGDSAETVADGGRTAWVMTYLFVVWFGLAVLSGILARFLVAEDEGNEEDGES
ncbi:hypothetical protein A3731_16450 [Roseovarius sp. HI0049]|nr:hypothetical protein A3731_16450 [Roseovarius sp. HI0049]